MSGATPSPAFRFRSLARALAPIGLTTLSACSGSLSTLDPAGPAATATARLWWVMLAGATGIFVFVLALVALAFLRPGVGERIAPKRWLVWGGLAFPGVVLSALLVFALATGERLLAHPGVAGLVEIEARPEQWRWVFAYPDGRTSVGVLHIPADQPINVGVSGSDVIHSFWVPRLGGKIDAIPGHRNVIRLRADTAGAYGGVCAEFCGVGHRDMSFTVVAHAPGAFEAALEDLPLVVPAAEVIRHAQR